MKFGSIILAALPLFTCISLVHANSNTMNNPENKPLSRQQQSSASSVNSSDLTKVTQNSNNRRATEVVEQRNNENNNERKLNQNIRDNAQPISISKNLNTAQTQEVALPSQPLNNKNEDRLNSQTTRNQSSEKMPREFSQESARTMQQNDKINAAPTKTANGNITLDQLKQAADQGDTTAQTNLGLLYIAGKDVPRDYEIATTWFKKAAQQGNHIAQTNLGLAYKVGQGVSKNPNLAVDYFKKAAEQGNSIAQYNLGVMLLDGIGTNQNRSQGIKWLRQAADQDNSRAKSALEGLTY